MHQASKFRVFTLSSPSTFRHALVHFLVLIVLGLRLPGSRNPPRKKEQTNAAEKAKSKAPANGRNEGVDPHWAYRPPRKSVLLDKSAEMGDFDWDALNGNDDLELWLIRIPEGRDGGAQVKPKYLETAQLAAPPRGSKSGKLGMLQRKHTAYDIWSVGDDAPEELPIGGEEIKGISCLLPRRSKKGKLYAAPKPIARNIIMSAQAVKPTPDPANADAPNARPVYKNPPRESHPRELLTHKFMPYGSAMGDADDDSGDAAAMDLDSEVLVLATPVDSPQSPKESKKAKGKKRKGEEASASPKKKPKKAKTAS
ncbi:hypothetical protein B0H10DRAFT_2207957 [Mycena sp. CBHHK59/15]|nr:hypothetical protein B0H10DRAFT_2207957 [Mycena sp. CBHHK59/15]